VWLETGLTRQGRLHALRWAAWTGEKADSRRQPLTLLMPVVVGDKDEAVGTEWLQQRQAEGWRVLLAASPGVYTQVEVRSLIGRGCARGRPGLVGRKVDALVLVLARGHGGSDALGGDAARLRLREGAYRMVSAMQRKPEEVEVEGVKLSWEMALPRAAEVAQLAGGSWAAKWGYWFMPTEAATRQRAARWMAGEHHMAAQWWTGGEVEEEPPPDTAAAAASDEEAMLLWELSMVPLEARAAGHVPAAWSELLQLQGWTAKAAEAACRRWTVRWYQALVDHWPSYAATRELWERSLGITKSLKRAGWRAKVEEEVRREAPVHAPLPTLMEARGRFTAAQLRRKTVRLERLAGRIRERFQREHREESAAESRESQRKRHRTPRRVARAPFTEETLLGAGRAPRAARSRTGLQPPARRARKPQRPVQRK
jgi:hypothetical protein